MDKLRIKTALLSLLSCSTLVAGLLIGGWVLVTTGLQESIGDDFVHGKATYEYRIVSPGGQTGMAIIAIGVLVSILILGWIVKIQRSNE